jgi:SAM-dependent methyltransferase
VQLKNLDELASKYMLDSSVEIENALIMDWYPRRIFKRTGRVASLLELGLGHGYTVDYFSEMTEDHHIIEGAESVISHFNGKDTSFKGAIHHAYFETFEPDQKYDVIVMGFVLEHVDNPTQILQKYKNFLTENGKIFVAVPNAKSLNRRLGLEMGMIENIYDLNETDHILGHLRNFCTDTLRDTCIEAGFKVTREEGIYLKPLPLGFMKTMDNFQDNLEAMLKVGVDFPELCVALLFELEAQKES